VRTYLLSRLVESLVVIWGVMTIVFLILRLAGDPAILMLPVGATEQQVRDFRHAMGFDRPVHVQYWQFLQRAVVGDFGDSLRFNQPTLPLVLERLPATIQLAGAALAVAVLLGGVAGLLAASYRGTAIELLTMGLALLGQATPVFWMAIMLILVFAVHLQWLPSGGRGQIQHMILPAITLALYSTASIARLFRSSLLETLEQDYVRTARAKGLKRRVVIVRHALRNALLPVVTMIGLQAGTLLGGSIITETIYAWPGVGRVTVQAIYNRDFPLVQAAVALMAVTFVLINFLVDVLYSYIDPRIRLTK